MDNYEKIIDKNIELRNKLSIVKEKMILEN